MTTSRPFLGSAARWLRRVSKPPSVFTFHYERVLGTSLELQVRTYSQAVAEDAERRVLAEIDRLVPVFSSYDATSEFRRWQAARGTMVPVSPELQNVLIAAEHWQSRSRGAFNPATEALLQEWRAAAHAGHKPDAARLEKLRQQIAQPLWQMDAKAGTAMCLSEPGLTLNAIAKGYIVDRACAAALENHDDIAGLVVNIGGDLCIREAKALTVGIADPDRDAENAPPFARVRIRDGALATSGDWRRGFTLDGKLYSHLIDPRTGWPVETIRSASVIAPDAATADVLATVFSVLSPEESLALADATPGVGCLLIARDGTVFRNDYWRTCEVPTLK